MACRAYVQSESAPMCCSTAADGENASAPPPSSVRILFQQEAPCVSNSLLLPLPAAYGKELESPTTDIKNLGCRSGGSITTALFLQEFVNDTPCTPLDIAAVA